MTKRFGVGFLVLGFAGVFVGSGGCAMFGSTRVNSTERPLENGYRVVLVECVKSRYTGTSKRIELRFANVHVPQSYGTDVMPGVDREYELRVSPDKWQAWVISKDSGEAVLSVDFKTHQAWTDPAQQPDWAKNE